MKQILKIADTFGTEFRTRSLVERLGNTLSHEDEYLFDMTGINMISRSAADELYNLIQSYNIKIVHVEPFVQQMLDAVTVGRFMPRVHPNTDIEFIKCPDIKSLQEFLSK